MHGRDGNSLVILIFSSLGHLLNHVCLAFYFVIVLSLEIDLGMPYHELIELWTLGALMVGVAAFMMLSGFALIAFIAASLLPKTKELVTQTV